MSHVSSPVNVSAPPAISQSQYQQSTNSAFTDDDPPPPTSLPPPPPPPPPDSNKILTKENSNSNSLQEPEQQSSLTSTASSSGIVASLSAAKQSILSFVPYVASPTDPFPWISTSEPHCICIYDPALDTSSSSSLMAKRERKKLSYKTFQLKDPQAIRSADPRKALSVDELLRRKRYKMKCLKELTEVHYQFDRNSPGDPPPPPPTAILVTGIHALTPFEHIRRQFTAFGKIAEHDFKLSPYDGNALGICWIRYLDEVSRSPYEDERKREMELLQQKKRTQTLSGVNGVLQDGHACASEAVKKINATRLIPASVSIPDDDGFVRVELDSVKKSKYEHAVKVEIEKRKPKRRPHPPQPQSRPDHLRVQKDVSSSSTPVSFQISKSPVPPQLQSSSSSLPVTTATALKSSQNMSGSSPLVSSHRNFPLPSGIDKDKLDRSSRHHSPAASSSHRPSSPHSAWDHPSRPYSDERKGRASRVGGTSNKCLDDDRPRGRGSSRWSDDENRRGRRSKGGDSKWSDDEAPRGRSRSRSLTPPPRRPLRRRSRSVSSTPPTRRQARNYDDDDSDHYYRSSRYSSPNRFRRRRSPPRRRRSPDEDYYRYRDARYRNRYLSRRSPSYSPPRRRSRRLSIDSCSSDDSDWSRRSDSDSDSTFSSEEERDKVYFHRSSRVDRRQRRRSLSRHRTPVRNDGSRRRDDKYSSNGDLGRRNDYDNNYDDRRGPLNSSLSGRHSSKPRSGPPERDKDAIKNLIVENGFPYITIEVEALRRVNGKLDSVLSDLKIEFGRFGVSNIKDDPTDVYIFFSSRDSAQRCHLVQNRQLFHGQPLNLTFHDALDTFKFLNDVTGSGKSAVPGGGGGRGGDEEVKDMSSKERIASQAREIIYNEVLQAFLKEYKSHVVAPKVWNALDARVKAQGQSDGGLSISSTNEQKKYGLENTTPDSTLPLSHHRILPTTSVPSGGKLKLPSFAKRNKARGHTPLRTETNKDEDMKESSPIPENHNKAAFLDEELKPGSTLMEDEPHLDSESLPTKESSPAPVKSKAKKRKQRREIVFSSTDEDEPSKMEMPRKMEPGLEQYSKAQSLSLKNNESKKSVSKLAKPATKKRKVHKDTRPSSVVSTPTTEAPQTFPQLQSVKLEDDATTNVSSPGERSSPDTHKRNVDVIMESATKKSRTLSDYSIDDARTLDPFSSGLVDDDEDIFYMKKAIQRLRDGEPMRLPGSFDDNDDDHLSLTPRHITGSARTEGYYKVAASEKMSYLMSRNNQNDVSDITKANGIAEAGSSAAANDIVKTDSRSARLNSRRLVQGFEQHKKQIASDTDILKFNQLKTRKKQMKFSRSTIHWYGLYSMESIPAGDMVIEYVGELIQNQVAERREKQYEKMGIGSSYLFRVDDDQVVDATRKGNLGRLINHCCTPNCTARIITINGQKKIVIYAKTNIEPGEEITYDYHFPIEDEKIVCLCGSSGCRGYLN